MLEREDFRFSRVGLETMDEGIGDMMDEKEIILKAVQDYIRNGSSRYGEVNVTCLPYNKTSCIEQVDGEGRSVMLDEFSVDGKSVWTGYSSRSQTVYISMIGTD